jgi:hypothetical protein
MSILLENLRYGDSQQVARMSLGQYQPSAEEIAEREESQRRYEIRQQRVAVVELAQSLFIHTPNPEMTVPQAFTLAEEFAAAAKEYMAKD